MYSSTVRSRRLVAALSIVAVFGVTASTVTGAEAVIDEAIRMRVLRLMFPNGRISASPIRAWDASVKVKGLEPLQLNDALRSERLYDVKGALTNAAEKEAATDVTDPEAPSDKRIVRLRLYRWTAGKEDRPYLIGVLHYRFYNKQPALCCQAIGELLLLSEDGAGLLDCVAKMPSDFTIFTSVRFADLKGDGSQTLLLSADFSGPGTVGVGTVALTVAHQKLKTLFWTTTAVKSSLGNGMFTLALDEDRTRLAKGRQYWFIRKTYVEEGGGAHTPPLTSRVSFPVNDQVPVDWPW
jgi:hypothetical protein